MHIVSREAITIDYDVVTNNYVQVNSKSLLDTNRTRRSYKYPEIEHSEVSRAANAGRLDTRSNPRPSAALRAN